MGALVELDRSAVERFGREHNLAPEVALPRLVEETVAAAKRAGRQAVDGTGQKLIYTRAEVDADRPATLSAGAGFTGDGERASAAFERWNDALAERASILRTFLRGEDVLREWIDDAVQQELDERWSGKDEQEIRRLIESGTAASAERKRRLRTWWRDWGAAAQYPWRTRALLAASFAFFGLVFGVPLARLGAWWSVLLTALVGAVVGLAIAEHGMRSGLRLPDRPE